MVSIKKRLRRFTVALPYPLQDELNKYVRSREIKLLGREREALPYWALLPAWLLHCYNRNRRMPDKGLLAEVLWGQFCLYLSIRIKDDLLDQDTDAALLVFAADLLHLEAMQTFSLRFPPRSSFWRVCFDSLDAALRSIVRADDLQKKPGGRIEALLKEYAGASAIFKIGAAAICIAFGRERDVRHAERFCDEMAIAGQLLDDLDDLETDLSRSRFNAVAQFMIENRKRIFAGTVSPVGAVKRKLLAGGFDRVLGMVLQRIDQGERALNSICSKPPLAALLEYRARVERMRRLLHRESVNLFFSRA